MDLKMNNWNLCENALSRRRFLGLTSAGLLAAAMGPSALGQILVKEKPKPNQILVVVFLRGGADGLNWVIPAFEEAYYRERPTVAVAANRALKLDGRFQLHPAMAPLTDHLPEIAFVHACGSGDQTRSHFEAMNLMERGLFDPREGRLGGWLAQYLAATDSDSPLRAVAIGGLLPDSLAGSSSIPIQSLAELRVQTEHPDQIRRLQAKYAAASGDPIGAVGTRLFSALDRLKNIDMGSDRRGYPDSELGEGLRQVAALVRSEIGLEIACLDKGNWDTHVAQGSTDGWFSGLIDDVAKSLAAFWRDLGPDRERVTVVVQTEFGRRLHENVALGTDHGRGSVMMVMGKGVQGGRVHGAWPGLRPQDLDAVGDLRVANDYRTVLAEVLERGLGFGEMESVFGGLSPNRLGLMG